MIHARRKAADTGSPTAGTLECVHVVRFARNCVDETFDFFFPPTALVFTRIGTRDHGKVLHHDARLPSFYFFSRVLCSCGSPLSCRPASRCKTAQGASAHSDALLQRAMARCARQRTEVRASTSGRPAQWRFSGASAPGHSPHLTQWRSVATKSITRL